MSSFYEISDLKKFLAKQTIFEGEFNSPYGMSYIFATATDILGLYFPRHSIEKSEIKNDFQKKHQVSSMHQHQDIIKNWGEKIFDAPSSKMLPFKIAGTPFQCEVWQLLANLPQGQTTTYANIARLINRPRAVRAVGTAVGDNPLSFILPCHRVVRQDGTPGGYRWGTALKQKILAAESAFI